jgi:hypothetical protein
MKIYMLLMLKCHRRLFLHSKPKANEADNNGAAGFGDRLIRGS